jgi:CRP-like cAMP-binding protein
MEILRNYLQQFSPLSDAAWDDFRRLFRPQVLKKNDYFARRGRPESNIGFLMEGTIRAFYTTSAGAEYNKTLFVPYCLVGAYSALITGAENLIDQQALEDCRLLVADYRRISGLLDVHPELERFARKLAESYFVAKEKREIELVLLDADERYRIFRQEFPGLENRIPQYHIASYLGITPTQLSRIRAKKS